MKKKFWITLVSLLLVAALAFTALAAVIPGDVDGDGKMTAFDAQMIAESNAGKRTLSAEQESAAKGFSVRKIIDMILDGSANHLAVVENGNEAITVYTVEEMLAAIAADGNTVITLQRNVEYNSIMTLPYSCTLDLNGFTIQTNPHTSSGIEIAAAGTQNRTTTIKNGTLRSYYHNIKVTEGAIVIDNMNIHSELGTCVALYDTADYKNTNRITNSTLSSKAVGCIGCYGATADFSATGITIENTTMAALKAEGVHMLIKSEGTVPCEITFGYDVNMYSYNAYLAAGGYTLSYMFDTSLTKTTTGTVTVDSTTYTGLTHWSTPMKPYGEDAIAAVKNGNQTVYVNTVEDMVAAVASTGNTKITLLKDVSYNAIIDLPYSCTLDLNSYTIRTNPNTSSGIEISAAGSANKTTTITNGKLVSYYIAVKVMQGAIVLDNMEVHALNGPSVALYDATDYSGINAITNCTLSSPSACVSFIKSDYDYSTTAITIAKSNLISHKNVGTSTSVIFTRAGSTTKFANVIFGEGVNMYTYAEQPVLGGLANTFFNGEVIGTDSEPATVTTNGITYEGMNCFTTEKEDPIKILMIGNSFCLSFTEELYDLAEEAGKDIYIANLYYGGCSIERHWKSLTGEWETVYNGFYVTDSLGRAKHGTILNAYDAVHFQDWDIISLQQHFDIARTKTYDTALASCTPYAANMYEYMREHFPNAKLYWHQTWAYEVGYVSSVASALPCPDVETQNRQRDTIIAVSDALAKSCNVDQIPCGQAWANARANPNIEEDPCKDDKCHDGGAEGGQYINACTWFETLFGISCVGSNVTSFSDYELDPALAAELQKAAHEAVAAMYGADYAK